MKRIATFLCFLVLMIGQKSFADYSPSWCDLSYSVYADYLYWKVTKPDDTHIEIIDVEDSITDVLFSSPRYSSGYRVGGALYYNCIDFDMRYSSLHNTMSHAALVASTLSANIETSSHFRYQVLDVAFGYTYFFQCHRAYVKPFLGAKLGWLKESAHLQSFSASTGSSDITWNTKTNAYGPMAGIEGSFGLCNFCIPLSLVARTDVSILSATSQYNPSPDFAVTLHNDLHYFLVVQDIYLALSFDFCNLSCFNANFQIGYEAQTWTSLRTLPAGGSVVTGGIIPFAASDFNFPSAPGQLGLGGLVAHFNLMF